MVRISVYWEKVTRTMREGGFRVLVKKTVKYIATMKNRKRDEKSNRDALKLYADVLFVNGCFLPHPARYRVSHQKEQLLANGMPCGEVLYEDITLEMVKHYRVFIFFRCPVTDTVRKFIQLAKMYNKTVFFDVDDLVIDTKYTNQVKYVQNMSASDKKSYDEGVGRMQATLKMCDAAITTTERLANELKNYVPEVFINRNTASQDMVRLSLEAIRERDVVPDMDETGRKRSECKYIRKMRRARDEKRQKGIVSIGYFSGSITHNDDFEMILPVIVGLMKEFPNLRLHIVGELDLPKVLQAYQDRVVALPFTSWVNLPKYIASVDINLVPLEPGVFNEAKSENKWVEAALVKVPTIASAVGALERMIEHNRTGILCENNEDWYRGLKRLVVDPDLRRQLAEQAHAFAMKNCTTIYTGLPLMNYIRSKMTPNVAFVVPSTQTSGGMLVAMRHCQMLYRAGYDVLFINDDVSEKDIQWDHFTIPVISRHETMLHGSFDKCVATLWSTFNFPVLYPNIKDRYYLVQGFETDFSPHGSYFKVVANATYSSYVPMRYITVSSWCQKWLKEDYNQDARYAPNGLDLKQFYPVVREFGKKKIRVLVEGNSGDEYKNVDESFAIANKLDPDKFEVWYLSYFGKPKEWYRVDKFMHKVPYEKVADVYRQCDILIKTSKLESFSYPPLEMMATGGYVVVAPNQGNVEYIKDGYNCLTYPQGDIPAALDCIDRMVKDASLRETLRDGGLETAKARSWDAIEKDVLALYQ